MYKFYNANPNKRHIVDCAVRSLSTTVGMSWRKAYSELAKNGERLGLMMDSVESIEDYLDKRFKRVCHYSKTLQEFSKEFPTGRYIVSMNGHLTSVINGDIIDTFDPSDRIIRCSWKVR